MDNTALFQQHVMCVTYCGWQLDVAQLLAQPMIVIDDKDNITAMLNILRRFDCSYFTQSARSVYRRLFVALFVYIMFICYHEIFRIGEQLLLYSPGGSTL